MTDRNAIKSANGPIQNTILLSLPQREFELVEPHLEFIPLISGEFLLREYEPIEFVCFMNSGIASLIVETQDGRSVEVGVAGREDLIGLPLIAGLTELSHSVLIQVPGDGLKVGVGAMKKILQEAPELRRILMLRLAIRSMQMAQNNVCNRLHNVKQRLSRWLLSTHDRLNTDVINTTHDFLARMVGTDRPSVSVAIGALQREGGIETNRGSIYVVKREKLEENSCECYAILERFNQALGLGAGLL